MGCHFLLQGIFPTQESNPGVLHCRQILYQLSYEGSPKANGGGGLVTKSCPTLATPWTIACHTPLSMEFSRQEYWSGLPFPSPGDLLNPGIEHRSPALQADSLLTELQGKPPNPEVDSLSLLQGIFPTQESNWGLLHCKWILYRLSYKTCPKL